MESNLLNTNAFIGTLININNKYTILNDKRKILENTLLSKLLPNDTVEYSIYNDKIIIEKLLERKDQILFGIVESINEYNVKLYFHNLPKIFSLELTNNNLDNYKVNSSVILKVSLNSIGVVKIYNSIKDRIDDKDLFISLYKEQAKLFTVKPKYILGSQCYYSNDFKNLTKLYTFNVDPTESKDFDDAISIDEIENKIYIHIVDANEQIEPLSINDINSLQQAFTLYLPEHIQNILPKEMAEDKLSLVEGLERKVITIEFTINPETQDIISHSIYKSIIKIKKRYDYSEFNTSLNRYPLLINFYNRWKKNTMNIPHIKFNVNKENGKLISYHRENCFDDAHKIIETLMILTNLTISEHIGKLIPQRYHAKVKQEFNVTTFTGNSEIDSILSIKKYKPAIYDSYNTGHFGLNLNSYTHFTSPIRRYFDVIIHRLLAGITYENIEEILDHINKQELYVDKLVKTYNNLKCLTYFEDNINITWLGYILSVTDNGYAVILEDNLYEVFIFKTDKKYNQYEKVNIKIKSINWLALNVKAIII